MEQPSDAPPATTQASGQTETVEVAESTTIVKSTGASSNGKPNPTSSHPKSPIYHIRLTWLLALATIAVYTLTVVYALGNTKVLDFPSIRLSISFTILVLRVLSEVTSLCMVSLIDSSLERLQWMLAARDEGFALPGFLALAPGTGKLGMLNLLLRGFRGGRRWSLLRLVLVLGVPAIDIVILSRVSAGLVFNEHASFPVAAGVGDFDASNVEQWREIAALQITTDFKNFLQNSQLAVDVPPLVRDGSSCFDSAIFAGYEACGASWFVHGGLQLVTPSPIRNNSLPNSYVYVVQNVQGVQLDFYPMASDSRFDGTTDCMVAGNRNAAVQFCVSNTNGTTVNTKYVHCPHQYSYNSSCLTHTAWQSSTGWTTSMTAHRRTADVRFSRYNYSTVSIDNLSPGTTVQIPASSLLQVFKATFSGNTMGFSSNTPGQQFIIYLSNYLTFATASTFGNLEASAYLRNLLALPLYYFQPTYLSNASFAITELNVDEPNPGVPRDLYTTAAFADPSYRVLVVRWSVWVYTIWGAVTIAFCLGLLVLGSLPQTAGKAPESTLWLVVDFVTNCELAEESGREAGSGNLDQEQDQRKWFRERLVGLRGLGLREEAKEMGRLRILAKP